ncbi:MAG: SUMF1/EgtB/PvdO family nonheme iron enzyme [Pirellulales bacterium]|nr:SUMF1/EgtB/PvdO family nonheme iron enzyme [Pirellulales bacterium]
MLRIDTATIALLALAGSLEIHAAEVDFKQTIKPLIESACLQCHHGEDADGKLSLASLKSALSGGSKGPAIVPGSPESSSFYTTIVLPEEHEDRMPPEGQPLAKLQTERIRQWIMEGAKWPESVQLSVKPRIDFKRHIQPILEENCLSCHHPENSEGDYDLHNYQAAQKLADGGLAIVPFQPTASPLYTLTIRDQDSSDLMPPADAGGPLAKESIDRLFLWISQGAVWPEDAVLKPREKKRREIKSPDDFNLIRRIHQKIVKQSKKSHQERMENYSQKIPETGAHFSMTAIAGGKFEMGGLEDNQQGKSARSHQIEVEIRPFWIGTYEVTWDEYEPFMATRIERHKNGMRKDYDPTTHADVDAVSRPTAPYMEMSFGMGQSGYPAISMTQHAANKYCQWLSAQTGHFYRLPTEAEWEYACRAGSTTAYYFGDDPALLEEYAWYYDNSNEKYQKVGQKKPNSWGLYDMHGNVSEWTADQFVEDYYSRIRTKTSNPYIVPKTLYPRTVRGGSWFDDTQNLPSRYRFGSSAMWKLQDPQLPKSLWYHTDARWLGFRIVRPLEIPTPQEMGCFWNSASGKR